MPSTIYVDLEAFISATALTYCTVENDILVYSDKKLSWIKMENDVGKLQKMPHGAQARF